MTGLLLGVDIGTASSKGVLVRPNGTVVAQVSRPHRTSTPRPGWFEHDAETVWWADFRALVGELLAAAGPERLGGLAVSGIGPDLLPADAAGRPLRPAILYGVDTRASAEIEELDELLGASEILRRCRSPLSSQAIGPKLRWLRRNEPAVWAATRQLLMCSSYLVQRLTGRYVLDHHSASQCTPLYDPEAAGWIPEWAELVAPGLPLPELAWSDEAVGSVTTTAAAATGLPVGLPVACGTIDAWAEAVSVGVRDPGDVMLMYGSTMFLVQVTASPRSDPGLWGTAGVVAGTSCLAAGMATSGMVTDWLRTLTGAGYEKLTAEAAAAPPGANGVLMLPYFAGERTPIFDPRARGVVAGLTLSSSRGELYRAALEGTAFGVRHNLEVMRSASAGDVPARRYVAVGGGTTGELWTQIVSDVTGVPQEIHRETVGAALGDALLAGLATDTAVDVAGWNPVVRRTVPTADTELYDRRYRDYRELYEATKPLVHRLAD